MSTQTKNSAALATRRRLKDDFEFYAEKALKIRTKDAQVVPLILNDAQRILHKAILKAYETTGMVRIIILKGRQQGLSTAVGGRLYFKTSQAQARKAVVVAHKSDSTTALFNMTKRYHENVPEILRPSTSYSSKKELTFDKLDSSYMVATAGGDGIARGETITDAHLSELAFWPSSSARENLNGLLQSVPDVPGTEVYIESTANGVTGPFYELWQGAVKGENGYVPVFIPWFLSSEYAKRPPSGFELSPSELDYREEALSIYGHYLTNDQLYWRRLKVNQNGLELFKQEYPLTPEEAFLTTGRPVFDTEKLTKRVAVLDGPIERQSHILGAFERSVVGELSIYRPIDPGETYYIGADVAMGVRGGDYSVAQVLDSKKRQCASYRAHVHPDYYSDVLYSLGMMYNVAKIGVESNNHGLLTVTRLYKDLGYHNIHMDVIVDNMTDVDTPKLGFRTTSKSKPMIIDALRGALRQDEIELNDKTTIQELITFVVKESGKVEAEDGKHDDSVISLAIANHVHDGVFEAIKVTDEYYFEMI